MYLNGKYVIVQWSVLHGLSHTASGQVGFGSRIFQRKKNYTKYY